MASRNPITLAADRRTLGLSVLAGAVVILVLVIIGRAGPDDGVSRDQPVFVVRRGPLTISVTQSGTVKARDQVILKSEVEGQTTVIYLVPEGTMVTSGQLLIELDGSNLEDQKVDQKIRVQNAEAAFIRARENLEVVKSQGISDVARAELDFRFAEEDLTQYLDGEYPKQRKEAESRIKLAKEDLERSLEKLKWSETLYEEKYISQTELEADRLTNSRIQLDYELAVSALDLLENFTYKRKLAELESNIEQTRMALERVQRRVTADVVQAEADLKAKDAEFGQQKTRLTKLELQITKTKLYAPIDGMVVYATSARGNWRGNAEPLDEGQSIRERQELIYLPTATSMMAEIKIHESSLEKVRLDLPVRLTVDAVPGKSFTGRVAKIAPLPDAQSMWLNPDLKVFRAEIYLDGTGQDLRTGMSCQAEILVEQYTDAVYVPVQAVMRIKGQPTVFVVGGAGQAQPRAIELGMDNNRMVHVISGLDAGERILLAPPLSAGAITEGLAVDQGADPNAASTKAATSQPQSTDREDGEPRARQPRDANAPDASGQESRRGRLTPEQREQRRKQFESMSPEEREKFRAQRQGRRQGNESRSERPQ